MPATIRVTIRLFSVEIIIKVSIRFNLLELIVVDSQLLIIIGIDGFCKFGDRCTFSHGDEDMRAKFAPMAPQPGYPYMDSYN